MRLIITLFLLTYATPCQAFQRPSDFDRELSRIAEDFKEVIMDEDECEKLKDRAEDITEEIEELLEEFEDFSSQQTSQLKQLKKEAEGIEDFIAVVANVGNATHELKNFIVANERIRANISYISKEEHCIDILVVEVDDYLAYLASNNSTKSFTLNFEWKIKDKSSFGNSKMGMLTKTIRHMVDNRDRPAKNNIDFQNISCQEFKKWGEN